jgi:hypothetical protein
MTPDQAINLLDQAVCQMALTRQQHAQLIQALAVLKDQGAKGSPNL